MARDNVVVEQQYQSQEVKDIIAQITYAIQEIDKKKRDLRSTREDIDTLLMEDTNYANQKENMDEFKTEFKETKDKVLSTTKGQGYVEIQDRLKQEIKDLEAPLSLSLEVLFSKTKKNEFVDGNGTKRYIKRRFTVHENQLDLFND